MNLPGGGLPESATARQRPNFVSAKRRDAMNSATMNGPPQTDSAEQTAGRSAYKRPSRAQASFGSSVQVHHGATCHRPMVPRTTCYNRFVKWRRAGVWDTIMDAVAAGHNLIGIRVPMHLPHGARLHGHQSCSNGCCDLEIVAVGNLHDSALSPS
jgi:hypothetical protein